MPQRSTRHLIALAVALVGVAVSVVTLQVEIRLEQDASYVSFCNLGAQANCDAVLGSRWARLLDLPIPVWAIATFGAGAAAAVPGAVLGTVGGAADTVLLALAGGSLGFGLVLLWVATVLIGTLCPLCITIDAVIVAWVIVLLPLTRRLQPPWLGWTALAGSFVAALVGGMVWATTTPAPATSVAEIRERHPEFMSYYESLPTGTAPTAGNDGHRTKGPASAPVTIVEFSDFQCPACFQAFRDLRELVASRNDVRLVFRHFPLDPRCNSQVQRDVHRVACLAAGAAECAGDQGRFWDYHDRLFENQAILDRDNLFRFARELSLDVDAFRTCLDAPETLDRVRADVREGARLAIASTPTIFINDRRLDGALERAYYDFAVVIEKEGAAAP